jgi:hypothetical protein
MLIPHLETPVPIVISSTMLAPTEQWIIVIRLKKVSMEFRDTLCVTSGSGERSAKPLNDRKTAGTMCPAAIILCDVAVVEWQHE